jgi:hypothetical protein
MSGLFRRLTPFLVRAISTLGGAGIIYHEVWVADSAEPLLVFVGLWLAGAPIADLLDKLRKLADAPKVELPTAKDDPAKGGTVRKPTTDRRRAPKRKPKT